ncbi:MAG: cob(I)yrinic acid a,c-diamide adenosyltransferase [Elusimicrobiota bacterium]
MKIYTRTGDRGETGLRGGSRVRKDHPRVAAYGEVDELNSFLGTALSLLPPKPAFRLLARTLGRVQGDLFCVGARLSLPRRGTGPALPPGSVKALEEEIDRMTGDLEPLRRFILPGGSTAACLLHLARSSCRRAERAVVALGKGAEPEIVVYLNRLSDYLFTAARWTNRGLGSAEKEWSHVA